MKVLKNLSYAALLALFLVGCGGGGGGSADNTGGANNSGTNSGTTNTGNTPSGTQDNQNSLAYVNGIYDIEGTSKNINPDGTIQEGLFRDKLTVTFDGNSLKGTVIDRVADDTSLTIRFGTITSDTGTQAKLYQDGSFTANRTINSIKSQNGININMKVEFSESGKFTENSIQGKLETLITGENLGKVATGTVTQNYHSVNKTATTNNFINVTNINQPSGSEAQPVTTPSDTHNNIEKELLRECNRIKNGKFVPFIFNDLQSYTCAFGNDRPDSYDAYKRVCTEHGFKFKDASVSFMCTNENNTSRSLNSQKSVSSALENMLENTVF